MDFTFDDYETEPERSEFLHTVKLKNQNGKVFYDKLTYVYLEMPNFTKSESRLETRLDKWLYFIKNLEDFTQMPTLFKDTIFEQAFEKASLANMHQPDLDKYENSLKVYRDLKGIVDTAFGDGIDTGKQERNIEIARNAKEMGLSIANIAKLTGLSEAEIEAL